MPRCMGVSITASALTMPVLDFAGCCREAEDETKCSADVAIIAGGGTQDRAGPEQAGPSLGGGTQERLCCGRPAGLSSGGGTQEEL
mmetsp:Transcript_106095/g.330936  ORF Transcript_106095/g.330936 Transcript_106095/m.330936 type:complete len:86 (+) Transcript_106095:822-1079(+)